MLYQRGLRFIIHKKLKKPVSAFARRWIFYDATGWPQVVLCTGQDTQTYKWCIDSSDNCTRHGGERLLGVKAAGTFFFWRLAMNITHDWVIHWGRWQSECVGWDLVLSLPLHSTSAHLSLASLYWSTAVYVAVQCWTAAHRGPLSIWTTCPFSPHKGCTKRFRQKKKEGGCVSPLPIGGKRVQIPSCAASTPNVRTHGEQ